MAARVCRDLCDPDAMAGFSRYTPARRHRGVSEARAPLWRVKPRRRTRAFPDFFDGRPKTLTSQDPDIHRNSNSSVLLVASVVKILNSCKDLNGAAESRKTTSLAQTHRDRGRPDSDCAGADFAGARASIGGRCGHCGAAHHL